MTSPLDISRAKMLLACQITGLSQSALARRAGVSSSTITRVTSGQATTTPSQTTMDKIESVVRDHITQVANYSPAESARLAAQWTQAVAPLAPQAAIPTIDPDIMRLVVKTLHHDLRHAWTSITPEALADMITGTYREAIRLTTQHNNLDNS